MPFSTAAAPFYCWRVMWPSRETRKNVTSDAWYRRSLPPPLFLTCYVIYHVGMQRVYGSAHTRFVDPAWFRPWYLALLASHLLLAIAIVPMVLMTVYHAIRGNFEKHRKIARWTWPCWMYVSVTGVVIYLLLYRIFPQTPAVAA